MNDQLFLHQLFIGNFSDSPQNDEGTQLDGFLGQQLRFVRIEDDFVLVNDNKEGFIKSYEQSYWNQHKDDK